MRVPIKEIRYIACQRYSELGVVVVVFVCFLSFIFLFFFVFCFLSSGANNWASEASPTLGCSIEISRYIYIYMYVGMYVCRRPKSVGGNTWAKRAHAQSQYCAVKSDQ